MIGRMKILYRVLLLTASVYLLQACSGDVAPKPDLTAAKEKSEHCSISDDVTEVRKNHMHAVLHHRDETVHEGIRTKQHSFKECINCHVPAADENGDPMRFTNEQYFCSSCHTYAGVKIDCFQCHTDQPEVGDESVAGIYQHKLSDGSVHHFSSTSQESLTTSDVNLLVSSEEVKQ